MVEDLGEGLSLVKLCSDLFFGHAELSLELVDHGLVFFGNVGLRLGLLGSGLGLALCGLLGSLCGSIAGLLGLSPLFGLLLFCGLLGSFRLICLGLALLCSLRVLVFGAFCRLVYLFGLAGGHLRIFVIILSAFAVLYGCLVIILNGILTILSRSFVIVLSNIFILPFFGGSGVLFGSGLLGVFGPGLAFGLDTCAGAVFVCFTGHFFGSPLGLHGLILGLFGLICGSLFGLSGFLSLLDLFGLFLGLFVCGVGPGLRGLTVHFKGLAFELGALDDLVILQLRVLGDGVPGVGREHG
ncbi:MAG: hypothetical protein IJK59_07580 [Firmicutes bacterium]|nr:hypothetical protein [Bacillota bacterium]